MSEGTREYRTAVLYVSGKPARSHSGPPVIDEHVLNHLAAEGWRVISMCLETQTSGARPLVLMERVREN